jgi:signal transduction histidine kinase
MQDEFAAAPSIVKQIVDRLGSEVNCADAPGGETILHIVLPC